MASYNTNTYPPPPPPMNRARGSSTGSRYVPDAYQTPPIQQAPPPQTTGYPFPYGAPVSRPPPMVPVPSAANSYGPMPGQHIPPQNTLHPSAAANPPYPVADDGYMPTRPTETQRRVSAAGSQHSRMSHESHRSRDSHHSHKSHRSRRSSSEERHRRHKRHEKERRERDRDLDFEKPKRVSTNRPTLGDSMFAVYDTIKAALGPRDKY